MGKCNRNISASMTTNYSLIFLAWPERGWVVRSVSVHVSTMELSGKVELEGSD